MNDLITNFFELIGAAATGTVGVVADIFGSVINIFYQTPAADGSGGWTLYGALLGVSIASPLVFYGINKLTNLFKTSVKGR